MAQWEQPAPAAQTAPAPQAPVSQKKKTPDVNDTFRVHGNHAELKALYERIRDCTQCALSGNRKNFVFGMGNPRADILFIGEAPGKDEDIQGLPFVGRSGKLLDKMLFAIGLSRQDVYIANVLKCRPPGNRDPLPDEVALCEPYLKQQIDIIQPRLIVALGRIAAQSLLKTDAPLGKMRREKHTYNGIPFIVTYHPSALLRSSGWKQYAWQDFKKILNFMEKPV
ncbi:MAG: uracil-DNA glycosylase [Calditrichaeota bacterium]|nr:MAG: uracil-DNA glycosylase [Calditrichota bacterium]